MRKKNKFINLLFYLLLFISFLFIFLKVRYINRIAVTNTQIFTTSFKIRKIGFEKNKIDIKEDEKKEEKELINSEIKEDKKEEIKTNDEIKEEVKANDKIKQEKEQKLKRKINKMN